MPTMSYCEFRLALLDCANALADYDTESPLSDSEIEGLIRMKRTIAMMQDAIDQLTDENRRDHHDQ